MIKKHSSNRTIEERQQKENGNKTLTNMNVWKQHGRFQLDVICDSYASKEDTRN